MNEELEKLKAQKLKLVAHKHSDEKATLQELMNHLIEEFAEVILAYFKAHPYYKKSIADLKNEIADLSNMCDFVFDSISDTK